jgi:ACS family glucarate transporter-like MFS transporter
MGTPNTCCGSGSEVGTGAMGGDGSGGVGRGRGATVPLLAGMATVAYLGRVDITLAAPGLMHDFGLTEIQMGRLFGAFLAGYTLFQIPSGWLVDRMGPRRVLLLAGMGWFATTAAFALLRLSTPQALMLAMLSLRFAFGICASPTYPAAAHGVAAAVPARDHGFANALVLASIGVGPALMHLALGRIFVAVSWRAGMWTVAAISLASAIAWWRWSDHDVDAGRALPSPGAASKRRLGNSLPRGASFWLLCASYMLESYLGYIFVFWFFLYLVNVRHFALLRANWLSALPWIATLIAIPAGGRASDLLVRRFGATRGRRTLPVAALIVAAGALLLGGETASGAVAVAALTVATAADLCTEGVFWAAMTQLAREKSGTAGGVMNFGGNLAGTLSPLVTPWLAAQVGWAHCLAITAGLGVVAALLWFGVRLDESSSTAEVRMAAQ